MKNNPPPANILRRRFGLALFNSIAKKKIENSVQSIQTSLSKSDWRFYIFQLGKKVYHLFENKLLADYNIPITPEDETIII